MRLVDAVPGIVELDMNPVVVFAKGEGCVPLDARITLDLNAMGSPDYVGPETHDDYGAAPPFGGAAGSDRRMEVDGMTGREGEK